MYQIIKTTEAYESPTNPRGTKFTAATFNDLVASIKTKGVLVPVIVRKNPLHGKQYEVIAGNRRLRAAITAGLAEIPADIQPLSDDEAREVQVIENLQREDVHPLEEGEAYRHLIEEAGHEIAAVAAKVGKSEAYVRQRLFLTNLAPAAAKAYRAGKMNDGHAVLTARLAPSEQATVLKFLDDNYELPTVDDLKDWMKREFDQPLSRQPWLKDKAANEAVGSCKECPPVRQSLFGDLKEGQCTTLKCWERKMTAYIAHLKATNPGLLEVSTNYGKAPSGVLSKSDYELLEASAKKHCKFASEAVVVEGSERGKVVFVCASNECKKHHALHSEYTRTPEEREKRKKEIVREKAKQQREYDSFIALISEKVDWPLTEEVLDMLIEHSLGNHGVTSLSQVAKRLGLKMVKEKSEWAGERNSFKPPLREWMKAASKEERLRLYVELELGQNSKELKKL
jgi:ParB/RepB/Spo0J family partition protein